jgi:hypothetical protein
MPKRDEPRVMVRMTWAQHEKLTAVAESVNIGLGGLLRETGVRYGARVAREVRDGSLEIRRATAVKATKGQVRPASSLAEDWLAQRQQRVNADRERPPSRSKR